MIRTLIFILAILFPTTAFSCEKLSLPELNYLALRYGYVHIYNGKTNGEKIVKIYKRGNGDFILVFVDKDGCVTNAESGIQLTKIEERKS